MDGKVLIAGGANGDTASLTLELFDPTTDSFVAAGVMSTARKDHAAALLAGNPALETADKVLLAGGSDGTTALASTEIWDAASGAVVAGPALSVARSGLSATTLLDGSVLIAGGAGASGELALTEVFDPASGLVELASSQLGAPRQKHLAIHLPHNSAVLFAGGSAGSAAVSAAELYMPWAGGFVSTGQPGLPRADAAASTASDGLLVIAGGKDAAGALSSSAEVYGFATLKTDKDDYAPGEIVTITGLGWESGDDVILTLHEVNPPEPHPDRIWIVTTDANGNLFDNSFYPEEHHLGVRFYLTAEGARSQAQLTFTDGNLSSVAVVGVQSPSPVPAGSTATYGTASNSVVVTIGGNNSQCSVGLDSVGLPTGAVATFTPSSVTGRGPGGGTAVAGLSLLSVSTTLSTPAGPHIFTVRGTTQSNCQGGAGNTQTTTTTLRVENDTHLTVNSATGVYGGTVNLLATLRTPNAAGVLVSGKTVNFTLNGNSVGSAVTNISGVATLTGASLSGINVGTYPTGVGGSFAGDLPNGYRASSGSAQLTVNQASTTTTLTSDAPDPSVVGQSVAITATVAAVAPGSGTPTGTVQFKDGASNLGAPVALSSGSATLNTTALTAGTHTLSAVYSGDTNFNVSTSAGVSHEVVAQASLSVTSFIGFDLSTGSGDTVVRSGQSVRNELTIANGPAPRADANSVTPTALVGGAIAATGTASAGVCSGPSPGSNNIADGTDQTFRYTCTPVSGDGTLTFTASATGTEDISGRALSVGPNTTNTVIVDSTNPDVSITPPSGNVSAPFTFNWSVTDPTAGGVSSGVNTTSCTLRIDAAAPVPVPCTSSNSSLSSGTHTVVVSGSDNAGNTNSASRTYVFDSQPPVVTVTFPAPDGSNGWFKTSPVLGTVTADDTTTGNSNVTAISCSGATVGVISGLGTTSASASLTVSAEGTNNVSCTATDSAGNGPGSTGSANTATVKIDTVKPTASASAAPAPNANGWNNSDVTVSFSGLDGTSGIDFCDADVVLSSDGAGQSASGNCTDKAGNVSDTATASDINIDKTKPTITGSRTPDANGFGWNNTDVTVNFSCADGLSGVDVDTVAGNTLTGEGAGQSVTNTGTCTDKAGNTADSATVSDINIDKTNPNVTATPSRAPDHNGWYNNPFSIDWNGTDGLSGIDACDADTNYSGADTASDTLTGHCTDKAGNEGTATYDFKYDATAPTLTLVFTPDSPNGNNGWWINPAGVPFLWTCMDATSLIDTGYNGGCPDPLGGTVTANGTTNFTDQVRDLAGNLSVLVNRDLKLDNVAPAITWNSASDICSLVGLAGWCRGTQTADFTAEDLTSGLANPADAHLTPSTGTNGNPIFIPSGAVSDVAGNIAPSINAGPYKIDSVAPTISLITPPEGASYLLNAAVPASFTCSDLTSGITLANCVGNVASGSNINTASVGAKTFTVNATDNAGNPANAVTHNYSINFNVCVLYDQFKIHKSGSTIPVKLRLCDVNGVNYSSSGVVVNAFNLTFGGIVPDVVPEDSGNANPDNNFRLADGMYIFNLSTKGLVPGTAWKLHFTATGDSAEHSVMFGIK